jgi:hypothetical protein
MDSARERCWRRCGPIPTDLAGREWDPQLDTVYGVGYDDDHNLAPYTVPMS